MAFRFEPVEAYESTVGEWVLKEGSDRMASLHAMHTLMKEGNIFVFGISCTYRDFRSVARPKFHAEASLVAMLTLSDTSLSLAVGRIHTYPLTFDTLGESLVRYDGITAIGQVRLGGSDADEWSTQLFEYFDGPFGKVVFIEKLKKETIRMAFGKLSDAELRGTLLHWAAGKHLPVFDAAEGAEAAAKHLVESAMSVGEVSVRLTRPISLFGQKGGVLEVVVPINETARNHIRAVTRRCGVELSSEATGASNGVIGN